MSTTKKALIVLAGVVLVVAIGFFIKSQSAVAPTSSLSDDTGLSATTSGNPSPSTASKSTTGTGATAPASGKGGTTVSGSQSSNSSLDGDMAAIDAQVSAVATDESNADKSLNDTPIEQSY